MYKIQTIGNFLVVIDTEDNGKEVVEVPASEAFIVVDDGVARILDRQISGAKRKVLFKAPIGECIDEADAPLDAATLKAWSRENLSFSSAGSAALPTASGSIIGTINRPETPHNINNNNFETGHDFTAAVAAIGENETVKLSLTLSDNPPNGRVWPDAVIDIRRALAHPNKQFFVWNHSGAYLIGTIINADTGTLRLQDVSRQAYYYESYIFVVK